MKLLVASTPKAGNTWLRYLLAAIYELPMPNVGAIFDPKELDKLPAGWVAHQHYYPTVDLLNWAQAEPATLLTIVRHPCDMLVSLYHYVQNYIDDERGRSFGDESQLSLDAGAFGERTRHFIKDRYFFLLNISVAWVYSGQSHVVRYEDLWRDPVGTLLALTSRLSPVGVERIERAVERCDIAVLRRLRASGDKFFREGSVGRWRELLPPEVIDLFRNVDPYPAQFAALGYTLDFDDPLIAAPAKHRPVSVGRIKHFENGVPVPAEAVNFYLSFDSPTSKARWPSFESVSPESFFAWMNSRAEADSLGHGLPLITNLAAFLRDSRTDLVTQYPDLFGKDRIPYILWLLDAQTEHRLDRAFIEPIHRSFGLWANDRDPAHRENGKAVPFLSNFASYVYDRNSVLQEKYPEVLGADWPDYALWSIEKADRVDPDFGESVRTNFALWANTPATDDPQAGEALPLLTNFARHVHQRNAGLLERFPAVFGADRVDYILWFIREPDHFDRSYIEPIRSSFLLWANRPATDDPQAGEAVPLLSNFARHVHQRNAGLLERFPAVFGADRVDYILWFIQEPPHFDRRCIEPIRSSFLLWANTPTANEAVLERGVPILTNFAFYIYQRNPRLKKDYPDIFGVDRLNYLIWFVNNRHADIEGDFVRPIIDSWARACSLAGAQANSREFAGRWNRDAHDASCTALESNQQPSD